MKKINNLFAVLVMLLACIGDMFGQGSPGFVFSASLKDSLSSPVRMAIDKMDNIYVSDAFRKKIIKFNAAGNFTGSLVTMGSPISIAISDANQLYFGDGGTGKIFRMNLNGTQTELYAGASFPSSMVFCSDGFLYVTDSKLHRVIVLDLSGNVIRTIGEGILTYPTGITFDKKNNRILVAEHGGIGDGFNPVVKVRIFGLTGNLITDFGSHGNGDGKFYRIQGLAVGRCGEIYVPEPYQGNVSVFTENTTFATRFGRYGDSLSQLRVPLDIAINSRDRVFITAENNGTIEIFDIDYVLPTTNITCGNKTICSGTTAEIPVHFTGTPPWTFTYTIDGLNPKTINNTSDNPYMLTISAPGNYQVIALSDSGHTGTCFSGNSVITVNPVIPTSAITTGNIAFCPGQTAGISVDLTGLAPWTFTYTNNGSNPQTVSNVATSPYLLNVSQAGNYQITALSSPGCAGSSFTGSANVISNPAPTCTIITGNTSICEGNLTGLAIGFTGTPPWSFTYTVNNENPTTFNNIIDNPYLLTVSIPGIYQIIHVQDAFCEGSVSAGSSEIAIKASPTSNISSGNTAICQGDSTIIIIDFTGVSPWTLTYTNNGLNPVSLSGITNNPYALTVSQPGIYQLIALSDANCSGTNLTGAAIISENPLPDVSLGPPATICAGDSIILNAGSFVSYLWNDSTNAPTLTAYEAGTYSVTVTDYNGCRNSASRTITSLSLPTSAITSGNTSICAGETTDIQVGLSGVPPWTFTYTVNGSDQQFISNILNSPYVLNVYKAGVYQITETIDANCINAVSAGSETVGVNSLPTYNILSGNAFICAGQATNILIDFTGTPPWNFTYTVNGLNPLTINGIVSTPFVLPVSQGGTYEIVALSDAHCNGTGYRGTVTITENPLPFVNLGPDLTIEAGEILTLDAGSSFESYLWSDGSSGQTLHVTASGTYGVTVTDYNGCSNSDNIFVNVIVPANKILQDVTVTGSRCFNAIQTITTGGGLATFVVPNGASATLIAGQNIICLQGTKVDSGGYMYGYITSDNTFCGGVVVPVVTPVNFLTAVNACPVPGFNGNPVGLSFSPVNLSENNSACWWDFGDNTSSSETNPTHLYQAPGTYLVRLTASNGVCNDSSVSRSISVVSTSVGGHELDNILKLYPNPSTGLITIEISNPGNLDLKIEINDMSGRHVYSKMVKSMHLTEKIDLGSFTQGIYAVKLSSGKITKITKLVLID